MVKWTKITFTVALAVAAVCMKRKFNDVSFLGTSCPN